MLDGDVCHCHVNSNYRAVGNLNQLPLMEIWNSPEFKRQRKKFVSITTIVSAGIKVLLSAFFLIRFLL
ncbi:MAG: hypothetical protein GY797_37925 [Deltaproteobacteria bacterium]|nr:hypothetical protein [Deltaproteobacteria bacterium]